VLLFPIFVLITFKGFGQQLNEYEEATETHVLIKGTSILMIPPVGFEVSQNFKGFQIPDNPASLIIITEMPAPFAELSKAMVKEEFASKGIKLINKKEIQINQQSKEINKIEIDGLKGYALYAQNEEGAAEEMYQVILFEEDGGYFIFMAVYLAEHRKTALEDLKKLILSFKRKS